MKPRLIQLDRADPGAIRDELLRGLRDDPAAIPPKYFYDALGARLFAAITELPEYYPTRTEAAIFARHADAMARLLPAFEALVDLGAGNCEKAARLFAPFGVRRYVAVDIAVDYLGESLDILRRQHPQLDMLGVGLDFSAHLALPAEAGAGPRLLFYPGSSIGNFTPAAALAFLRRARAAAQGGGLLIGVDLVKPVAVLEAAYADPLGVTAAFNRNVLAHVRRVAGADFSLADWGHVAFYNAGESRIEMHLEAVRDVAVRWPGGERRFAAGERIHTENSYKWRVADFAALLVEAGFRDLHHWTDDKGWFGVFLARA
ncbi:L-histidine N(alpha)-methyltransferase [Sulfurisoma sediminicola]|nr:L-histidine N(alpha)-methyltransferase [Sulfurisoma sediminicola]